MSRPARICSAHGCPNPVPCLVHTVTQNDRRTKDPQQARFYRSRRWTDLSRLVRAQETICRICESRPSTNVDHIDGDWQNNARENLRALCTECERSRTGKQHRARRGGGGVSK